MMIVVAPIAVAIVCFILYALDRKSKVEPIDWSQASKLSAFGGLITAGVVFATTTENIPDLTKPLQTIVSETQDMFVGVPTF
jgi:hypothetical protein